MTHRLIETSTGAQLLPPPTPKDDRAVTTAWLAHLCMDADNRRHPAMLAVAENLHIEVAES